MSKSYYIATEGQGLVDVAIAEYGDISQVFQLLMDNPNLSGPDHELTSNNELVLDQNLLGNKEVATFDMVSLVTKYLPPQRKAAIVREGQTLAEIATQEYGDLSYIFQLLEDNPELQSPDAALNAGDTLLINRELALQQKERQYDQINLVRPVTEPSRQQTLVYEGQSVLDLALQEYGDIAAALELGILLTSAEQDVLATPEPGTSLSIRKNRVYDAEVAEYYQNRNIRVNTGRTLAIEGIGLCSSDGYLLVSLDNFILKASDL